MTDIRFISIPEEHKDNSFEHYNTKMESRDVFGILWYIVWSGPRRLDLEKQESNSTDIWRKEQRFIFLHLFSLASFAFYFQKCYHWKCLQGVKGIEEKEGIG